MPSTASDPLDSLDARIERLESFPDSEFDDFPDEEPITANLSFKSVSPRGRFTMGILSMVPKSWRGPIIISLFALVGFLIYRLGSPALQWLLK